MSARPSRNSRPEETVHLVRTKVMHAVGGARNVEFLGGDHICVRVAKREAITETDALGRAKAMMVEMTAFRARDAGRSVDYDALSSNFDDEEPVDARH